MKVLIGIPCLLNGGTEVQTLSLVQALVMAGHYPIVACYFEWDSQMVKRYKDAGAKVFCFSENEIRPKGIKDTTVFLWKNFKKIVKISKPDVAHIQYMAPGAIPILLLRLLGIKKIFATSHTDANIYGKKGLKIIRFLTKHILSGFQTITLTAERGYFNDASLFNGELKKHFTIYNSLPFHIKIKNTPKIFPQEITIGVVSRLEKIKGMDLVIPAIAKMQDKITSEWKNKKIIVRIVGEGSQRVIMEEQVKKLLPKIKNPNLTIEFLGRKAQNELEEIYDSIDILLMPSRSEGFGLTAIEGMARGCVPIVANTGGLPEVVTPESGLLHNPENIDDLADKIQQLIQNTSKLKELSQGAIQRANHFSFNNYAYRIHSWYSSI